MAPMDQPTLRKDAARSRQSVLEAASRLFADRGLDVGFDEIAREAGVGVGTVYRRFPTRDELIEALFAEKLAAVIAIATDAADLDDPWDALCQLCENSVAQQQQDRGLAQVLLRGIGRDNVMKKSRDRLVGLVDAVVRRAQDSGVTRADIEPGDIVVMLHLLSKISTPRVPELWRRHLALFLDSIRADGHQRSDLPLPAVDRNTYQQIAQRL